MGAFDEGPLADPEYHEPVPLLIPVQERHVEHPPADHDKLAWCRETIAELDDRIAIDENVIERLNRDVGEISVELRGRLGAPDRSTLNWSLVQSPGRCKHQPPPHKGTWEEAIELAGEWNRIDDMASDVRSRLFDLRRKRGRCNSIQSELESSIKHWEGV